MILFDKRWFDCGGIGRFSESVYSRLTISNTIRAFSCSSHPTSLISILQYSFFMMFYKKIDGAVLFSPGFIPPIFSSCEFIFTMHDLNHIDVLHNSSTLKRFFYDVIIKRKCHAAKYILTVSEFSKNQIIAWSNVSADKVVNVGNGVELQFSVGAPPYVPGFKYLLCVGNRKPHKNEGRALLAFSKANIYRDIKFIFTGTISDELRVIVHNHQLEDRVVFLGKISEEQLPSIYRGALGLVFPSLYEGFGLPVVEAMACGVPVLTSNTTSLPEVAGDAALLVNPESVDEIRAGIERLVNDEGLRSELIAKGLERAKLFSWDAVAARVQAVLDEVTNQHGK